MTAYFWSWLAAFALTQVIEMPLYLRLTVPRRPWVAFGASAWTHPLLWFAWPIAWNWLANHAPTVLLPWLDGGDREAWLATGIAEVAIVALEALWFQGFGGRRPWRASLLANGASCGAGVLLHFTIGWP
jgi:hypothetical protein